MSKRIEIILKVSKQCNLRCSYCYEFPNLHKTDRLSLSDLKNLFSNIAIYLTDPQDEVNILWHGGEPLLIPLAYYEEVKELQNSIFGDRKVTNNIQTNLTILTDAHLSYFSEGNFFSNIGVSFDPFNTERVFVNSKDSKLKVLKNMSRLVEADVKFSVITVVTALSPGRLTQIFSFFHSLNLNFKILHYYRHSSGDQLATYQLSYESIVGSLIEAFDNWLSSDARIRIDPIDKLVIFALAYLNKRPLPKHSKENEFVFMVNTDGRVWGQNDVYDEDWCYGNILTDNLLVILDSSARQKEIERAKEIAGKNCNSCEYFGYCTGFPIQTATADQLAIIEDHGCLVKPVISHIVSAIEKLHIAGIGRTQSVSDKKCFNALQADALA